MTERFHNIIPSLLITLAMALWSSIGIVVRIAGVPIYLLMFYSCLAAVAVQTVIIIFSPYRSKMPPVRVIRYPVLLGLVSFVNMFSFYYAYQNTTIAVAVLTHYTAPVLVAFLAPIFLAEHITRRLIAALIIASCGLLVMLGGPPAYGSVSGIIAGLVSGVAYAMIIIMARIYTQNIDPLFITYFSNLAIVVLIAPAVREFPVSALGSFLFMGIAHSTIAPLLYYRGLRSLSANRTAVLGYLEPVGAIMFGMIFLNETPRLASIAGGAMIILSGYMTVRGSDQNG